MKNKKRIIICSVLTPIILLTFSMFLNLRQISDTEIVRQGEGLYYNFLIDNSHEKLGKSTALSGKFLEANLNSNYDKSVVGELKIAAAKAQASPKISVCVGGESVGIKLKTAGVLVVGLSDITSISGKSSSPASSSGIQIGDIITKINNETVINSINMSQIINKYRDENIIITVMRNDVILKKNVTPLKSSIDGSYKLGLWIRDSTAGVGTLTFYDKKSGKFAALGHPITDVDTGTVLKVGKGNIINSTIISIKKGLKGNPGEVRGIFVNEEKPVGDIEKNTICGIYGSRFINGGKNNIK